MLRQVPGLELPEMHKPKQKVSQKAGCLCGIGSTADAVAPAMVALFRRFDAGDDARNEYEARLYRTLGDLTGDQREALRSGFNAWEKLPRRLRDCLFDDRLADPGERGLNPADIIAAVISEGLGSLAQTVFSNSDGIVEAGKARPFDVTLYPPPNGGSAPRTYTGPWPWLTAIRPNPAATAEFGSVASVRADAGVPPYPWQPWNIAKTCTYSAPPAPMSVTCVAKTPPPPPPGTVLPNFCEGGEDYTLNGQCLQFGVTEPGATIALHGSNFITASVTVRFQLQTNASVRIDVPALVFGDQTTPVSDNTGHTIHDWRVQDMAVVTVPHDIGPNQPLPAGLYDVSVLVDNIASVNYAGGVAPKLESNKLILQVDPDPNSAFNLWTDHGHCYSETDGLGSDEIWWDAWVVNFTAASKTTAADLGPLTHIEFARDPWDDMDSGEDPGGFSQGIWNGPIGHGTVVAGLLGFEVDSEAAARDQLKSFGEAFAKYLGDVWAGAVAGEGTAASIASMISLTVTQGAIALAIIAAVVLIIGLFWAAWAPADQIAIDLLTLTGRQAWDLTEPAGALPPLEHTNFGTDQDLSTSHTPLGKHQDNLAIPVMRYSVEHEYWSGNEDSHYGLVFQLTRS